MKARTALAIVAMEQLAADLVSDISGLSTNPVDLGNGPLVPGQSKRFAAVAVAQVFSKLIIPQTRFPLQDCVKAGKVVLFGTSDDDANEIKKSETVSESHLFWYAVSRSAIKKFTARSEEFFVENFTSQPAEGLDSAYKVIAESGMLGIVKTLVQIGDIALHSTGGTILNLDGSDDTIDVQAPFDVDELPDGPATRISKSRSADGRTSSALAWRGNSIPAMYLLPRNVIKAGIDMMNFAFGGMPIKGHTTNELMSKTFINVNKEGAGTRIPTDVVQRFENALDAEYVPFYFHDVRTNEFVTFHAFLETLSDSYSPQYSREGGYGRIDKVKIYKETSRKLQFSFYIAATSKEDFDEMWFKINKLTTLVYPQWTKGVVMTDSSQNTFVQPFSQGIGATPLVRLRIGDVIKSNYSRFNLARMFGVGEREFKIDPSTFGGTLNKSGLLNVSGPGVDTFTEFMLDNIFGYAFGSPMAFSFMGSGDSGAALADRLMRSLVSNLTINGFVNPVGAGLILRILKNPDKSPKDLRKTGNPSLDGLSSVGEAIAGGIGSIFNDGYLKTDFPFLKASPADGYKIKGTDPNNRVRTTATYLVKVKDKIALDAEKVVSNRKFNHAEDANLESKTVYQVVVSDVDAPASIQGKTIECYHSDLMPNPTVLFNTFVGPLMDPIGAVLGIAQLALVEQGTKRLGLPADAINVATRDAKEFIHPGNNVVTRAFENSGGRGLAGVIDSLSYTWIDNVVPWETDWNGRAPKVCKVTVGFDVIHDLPPGIDSSGYNRAPIYNVGDTMHSIVGDPQPDGGIASKQSFTRAHAQGSEKFKK